MNEILSLHNEIEQKYPKTFVLKYVVVTNNEEFEGTRFHLFLIMWPMFLIIYLFLWKTEFS